MTTRSRIRRVVDFGRLRDAMSAPGADPRSWLAVGRIDLDPDAVRWERGIGWVADVTVSSGELSGENFIPCRIPSPVGGTGELEARPIAPGAEVLLAFADGDPNVSPMILGYFYNGEDLVVPDSVNGQTIDESLAKATHILVTTKNVEQQVGNTYRVKATSNAKLLAQNISLAEDAASQKYVRGDDFSSALDTFLTDLTTFLAALATAVPAPPNGALTTAAVAGALADFLPKIEAFKNAKNLYLSTRVKAE